MMVNTIAIDSLLNKLSSILEHETNLVLQVKDEFEKLESAVKRMHHFSSPGGGKRYKQDVLDQIMGLVFRAEDAAETYVVKQRGNKGIISKVTNKIFKILSGRTGAEEIISIVRKFEELYEKHKNTGGGHCYYGEQQDEEEEDWREASVEDHSEELEYFKNVEEEIIKELVKTNADEVDVIPIVGMNDFARSTVAKRVFNDRIVVNHFDLRAWILVPRLHNPREILEAIMKWVVELSTEMKEMMSNENMQSDLYRYLDGSRYLIVLDGVCSPNVWHKLDDFLPYNMFGSRIILTTQFTEVALYVKPSGYRCDLQCLSEENGWNLLSNKVFRGEECPSNLMEIGHKIAEKCQGLPLVIILIAGILRRKKTFSSWYGVYESLSNIAVHDELQIFELCYMYLPDRLKRCFLYLGHFPEDREISASQLIRLWSAEGFIPQKEQKLMEEVAEQYMWGLVDRNLIQPVQKKYDGGVKSLRIFDQLRLFCISKTRDIDDLEVRMYNKSSSQCKSRTISVHTKIVNYLCSNPTAPKVRSFLCLGQDGERLASKHLKFLYNGYKLLRVLELWGVVVDNIPSEIAKLIFLRYLRLKSDSTIIFPISIWNLWNLETLEVMAPLLERPHLNLWKMPRLRHFHFNGQAVLGDPPEEMVKAKHDGLTNLQTLSAISPDSCTESVLSKVPNLLKLGINGDLEKHKDIAFDNLDTLTVLRELKLVRDRRYGKLSGFPDSLKFPPHLVKLTLSQTELLVDPMKQLGRVANLQVLKLVDSACSGKVLDCTEGGFPKLKVLKLINLGISDWRVSNGSMPVLEILVIDRCGGLMDLPSSLQISTLREMQLSWPNAVMVKWGRDIEASLEKEQLQLMIDHAEETDITYDST